MKIIPMVIAAIATVAMAMAMAMAMAPISITSAPVASAAYPVTDKLGSELTMTDTVGQVVLT
jgi:hypothetical protein